MTTNTTTKIVMLAVLIVSAMMSGCISPELMDSQTVINTDVNVMTQQDVEPTPVLVPESRHIQVCVSQESDTLLVTVNGGDDYQQLREIQVTVNNETQDIYAPEYQVQRKVKCTTIGEWQVVIKGIFDNGEVQTIMTTSFCGLPDSYTETTIVSDPVPIPTVVSTPVPTVVKTPAPVPTVTPTAVKNEPCERKHYISQCGGYREKQSSGVNDPDNSFHIVVYCDKYRDVEKEAECAAELIILNHPNPKSGPIYSHRVHPDLISYDVYVNGELTESIPAPTIEEYDGRLTMGFCAIVPKEDYPHNVVVVTQYVDGETFEYQPSC